MEVRDVMIPVGDICLEAKLGCDGKTSKGPGLVVCHPHPRFGGTMDNNVVRALCDAFVERGYVTVAFNFRGVGSSGGRHEDGEGEVLDVLGVLNWLEALPGTKGFGLGVLGYSFGAWVALRAATQDARVRCAGAVAPPLAMYSFSFLKDLGAPLYVVSGGRDTFCPPDGKESLCSQLANRVSWKLLERADHFFWNCEREAAEYLAEGFGRHLPP